MYICIFLLLLCSLQTYIGTTVKDNHCKRHQSECTEITVEEKIIIGKCKRKKKINEKSFYLEEQCDDKFIKAVICN